MAQKYTLQPETLINPHQFSPYLTVSFRRGVESKTPIHPATGLEFSFEQPDDHREVFTGRLSARDVRSTDDGLCTINLPEGDIPKFALKGGRTDDIVVKLHAWKGERHLGVWEVGTLSGERAYVAMD
ncbi:hypothetical protein VPNG_08816 [Cytospora leucostoma]|uniref:Uncharacterized protein n=1 Tax=Cytospora leucostoma TaxID=1230097 RepID=A0A423W1J1_9PEZI|nr:hypothetical protein VPNG_08816 [Cytospora leucostoma]